jgi:hypothetical protein
VTIRLCVLESVVCLCMFVGEGGLRTDVEVR